MRIINFNKLSKDEGDLLEAYFDAHIAPFLSPMIIGKQQPFPFLANKQLYAVVLLTTQKGKKKDRYRAMLKQRIQASYRDTYKTGHIYAVRGAYFTLCIKALSKVCNP